MQKIGKSMSIAMGIALSLILSLVGNLMSKHFTTIGFLLSFALSIVLSLLISLLVPIRPISDKFCRNIPPQSMKRRCAETLVSDLIFTPLLTVCNVLLAFFLSKKSGAAMPLVPAMISSLLINLVLGFILIFILMPLFLRRILKENGIDPANARPPHQEP